MVLIGLVYQIFWENLIYKKLPNHVIHVFKQDVSKIYHIDFMYNISAVKLSGSSIDLTKLMNLSMFCFYLHLRIHINLLIFFL